MICSRTKSLFLLGVTLFTLTTVSAAQKANVDQTANVAGYVAELAEPGIDKAKELLGQIKNVEFKDMLVAKPDVAYKLVCCKDVESIWTGIKDLEKTSLYLRDIVAPIFLVKVSASFALAAVEDIFSKLTLKNIKTEVKSTDLVQAIKTGFNKWDGAKIAADKDSIEKDGVACKLSDLKIDVLCARVAQQATQALKIISVIAAKCTDGLTYNDFKTVKVKYTPKKGEPAAETSLEGYINCVLDQLESDLSDKVSGAIEKVTKALEDVKKSKAKNGMLAGIKGFAEYAKGVVHKILGDQAATANSAIDLSELD